MADLTPQEKRGFSNEESSPVVAKLLGAMLDYAVEEGACQEADPQVAACRRAVARLEQSGPVPEIEVALLPVTSAQDFDAPTAQVREAIETNRPEAGLDRLPTYVVRYIRTLCADRGIAVTPEKPLHGLFGAYVKQLRATGGLQRRPEQPELRPRQPDPELRGKP